MPIVAAIWRSAMARCEPHVDTSQLSDVDFVDKYERRILFGVSEFDTPSPASVLNTPYTVLAAATNATLIRRRNHNAHNHGHPLRHRAPILASHIHHLTVTTATAMRSAARREENRIYTHYEGWLPDDEDKPMTKWTEAWCPLVTDAQPCVRLRRHAAPADPMHAIVQPQYLTDP